MPTEAQTARRFVERLETLRSPDELAKYERYFKTGPGEYAEGDTFMGVRMGQVFELAKEFAGMELDEIERLLDQPYHESRAGAMRIMATQARGKRTPEAQRKALYDLYVRRHDRIDNWDLVDLAAWDVVGRWLIDKPRDVLDTARSVLEHVGATDSDPGDDGLYPRGRRDHHVPDRRDAPQR